MTTSWGASADEQPERRAVDRPPLSIAHVLVSLEVGGAERLVVDMARAQAARGHRVAVFVLGKSKNPMLRRLLDDAKIPVEEFERRPEGIDLPLIPRLAAALRARHPDVVHTHNEPPLIYGTPAARLIGVRTIHTCHGPRNLSRGARTLAWGAARLTYRYVAVTESLVTTLQSSGDVPRDKLRVIDNGVNLERFQVTPSQRTETRAQFGIPPDAFVVGTVGRLAPEKNYPFLLRAAEPLIETGAHVLFVGDGSERARLEAQAASSSHPAAIHFAGVKPDVTPLLAAMDVFSLSSTFEGLPLALLEAMASGRTIVASAIGGIPLVVEDGITGLLVPPGDESGFTERLRSVRENQPLAAMMAEAGRARAVGRYGLDRMLDQYVVLYREAIPLFGVSRSAA